MSAPLFRDDFPPAGLAEWRALVESELKGAAFDTLRTRWADGMMAEPLYTSENALVDPAGLGLPGEFPFARGARLPSPRRGPGWWLGTELGGESAAANAALLADLELGAELVVCRLRGDDALPWGNAAQLERLFAGVEPRYLRLLLEVDAEATPTAAGLLLDWASARGLGAGELQAFFGCDPLATLARRGGLAQSLEQTWADAAALVRRTGAEAPASRALTLSTRPYAAAGAGPAQILACGLAGFVELLRALDGLGVAPAAAAPQVLFTHAVGSEIFLEIAKWRAMRWLVAKVLASLGAAEVAAGQRHVAFAAETEQTRVDPWVNLLRGSAQVFAAAVAGADGIVALPYDHVLGRSDGLARRVALTTQQVLAEESQLARVADPAGGSWALDTWTEQLARRAWTLFQEIEGEGGLVASLRQGLLQRRIGATAGQRRQDVAKRRRLVVGVSAFPLLDEERPRRESPAPAAGVPQLILRVEKLAPMPAAAPFEALRLAADAAAERPRIFLANLGAPADHRPRTEFCQGLFPAGGIATVDAGSCAHSEADPEALVAAWRASGCRAAVICGSDAAYAASAEAAARALKAAGAAPLLLAGRPGDNEGAWRAAGIDDFVVLGGDAVALLGKVLDALGVQR